MNQFFNTETEITAWLDAMAIENYTLIPHSDKRIGFTVDVLYGVDLSNRSLDFIPVQFGVVQGHFDCSHNKLKNLIGAPTCLMSDDFTCYNNKLTSLEGCPQLTKYQTFSCSYNRLKSLEHGPTAANWYWCNHNQLSSLEFCPETVRGDFHCSTNQIESLEFCPQEVKGKFFCNNNPLLGDAQEAKNFLEIKKIQQQYQLIKKEKTILEQKLLILTDHASTNSKTHKI